MIEQKPQKIRKTLICDCYSLDLYMVPKASILAKSEYSSIIAKRNHLAALFISAEKSKNKVRVKVITTEKLTFNQTIKMVQKKITFGKRRYFLCDCRRRVNSLYLKHGKFACRHCHQLAGTPNLGQ